MIQRPANVNADQPVPFNAFGYETYTTKKGEEAKRRVQVRNVLPAADFVSHFNKQLAVFRDHHFKSVFLAQQILMPTEGAPTLSSVLMRMAAIIGCEGVT